LGRAGPRIFAGPDADGARIHTKTRHNPKSVAPIRKRVVISNCDIAPI
jgi:hypothetical protein